MLPGRGLISIFIAFAHVQRHLEIVMMLMLAHSASSSSSSSSPSTASQNSRVEDFTKLLPQQQQWIVDYLLRYGYLDFSLFEQTTKNSYVKTAPQRLVDVRRGKGYSDDPITAALRRFQAFSGLSPNGKIDFATRQQLVERRCGVRDLDTQFKVFKATTTITPTTKTRRSTTTTKAPPTTTTTAIKGRQKRYAVSRNIRWRQKQLTYKFLNFSAVLGSEASRKLVVRALGQWAKAAKLEIREIRAKTPADITFLFAKKQHGDAYRFDGNGAVLAHAFFPGEQRGGEVHFDDDEAWFDRDIVDTQRAVGVDLYAVALHEIGHALGLGHSSAVDSVMNPWYNNYAARPRLGNDDLFALDYLYGEGSLSFEDEQDAVEIGSKPDLEQPRLPSSKENNNKTKLAERVPDVCDTDFDAISIISDKIFAFRNDMLWRFDADGALSDGFPMLASDFFMGLPRTIKRVDTFYQRRSDKDVIVFSQARYWRFRNNNLIPGFPPNGRPILELGLPSDVQRVDAVFVWSGNLYTYLVAGDRYWRLDEVRNHVDFTYPRPVERFWRGVPLPLNSAFLNTDGVTYFVVGFADAASSVKSIRRFIPFDDYRLEAARSRPLETTKLWTACLALNTSLQQRAWRLNSNNNNNKNSSSNSEFVISYKLKFLTASLTLAYLRVLL